MDARRYVTYLPDGALDGCYLQDPPEDHAARMIPIDEAQAGSWVSLRANEARDGVEPRPPIEPTEAEIVTASKGVIQRHLDTTANAYGYDTIVTMMSYAEEPAVPRYQIEGLAARAWRSLCWAKGEEIRAAVLAGERGRPTDAELVAAMPTLDLPPPAVQE